MHRVCPWLRNGEGLVNSVGASKVYSLRAASLPKPLLVSMNLQPMMILKEGTHQGYSCINPEYDRGNWGLNPKAGSLDLPLNLPT